MYSYNGILCGNKKTSGRSNKLMNVLFPYHQNNWWLKPRAIYSLTFSDHRCLKSRFCGQGYVPSKDKERLSAFRGRVTVPRP